MTSIVEIKSASVLLLSYLALCLFVALTRSDTREAIVLDGEED